MERDGRGPGTALGPALRDIDNRLGDLAEAQENLEEKLDELLNLMRDQTSTAGVGWPD